MPCFVCTIIAYLSYNYSFQKPEKSEKKLALKAVSFPFWCLLRLACLLVSSFTLMLCCLNLLRCDWSRKLHFIVAVPTRWNTCNKSLYKLLAMIIRTICKSFLNNLSITQLYFWVHINQWEHWSWGSKLLLKSPFYSKLEQQNFPKHYLNSKKQMFQIKFWSN